ncbi:MAG: AsmA family protein [Cereibacter sphaeroides]|uniref:AsmA family protein n=1 Tax=Cereibacter sphaeroides TaxID=1063 RepID=A0A2W5TVH5_CERSP|nr:MAG: AsmA family protein [Cereibacter sphaeroides]
MRWLFRIVGTLLFLALLAIAALFLIPTETVARLASSQIERLTGRSLTIEGSVRPKIWPELGVRTGPVTLANADWSEAGPMLTAEGLSISIDMSALIGGTVRITGIELIRPELLLETAADGRANWDLSAAAPTEVSADTPTSTPVASTPFTIDRARIEGGRLRYIDHATGQEVALSDVALDAAIPDFDGPAQIDLAATMNGQAFQTKGTIGAFGAFLDGKVVPVALKATIGGSNIGFDGRFGTAPVSGEGQLVAALDDPPAVFALLAQPDPELPQGLGRDRIAISGAATLTPKGTAHLRDGKMQLDGNALSGAFDYVPGKDRPKLTAQLSAAALDLRGLTGTTGGSAGAGGNGGAPSSGWSRDTIDASALGVVDAAVSLAAESVDLGTITLGRTRLGIAIDAARAVTDLKEVQAYGGTISGQVIVNARNGLSTRTDLSLKGMALQPLLVQFADFDRLLGTGDLRFNLLASGNTLDALMRSLSGEGTMALGQGEIKGLDLAGMIMNMDPNYVGAGSKTVYDRITASFTVANGVLSNGDLAFSAPLLTASGSGAVNIGEQTLDYTLIPLSAGGKDLNSDVQVPLRISGPWAAPSIRLDLAALAERKLREEREKLRARAEEEITQKLQEETGITPLEGESLEDTARRAAQKALQDEAARQLNKLLGGN